MRAALIIACLFVATAAATYSPILPIPKYCNELCDPQYGWWKWTPRQYKIVPVGNRWHPRGDTYKDDVSKNFLQYAWEEQQPLIFDQAVADGKLSSAGCKFVSSESKKLEGCYASIWAWRGKQFTGVYGFVYANTYACPSPLLGGKPSYESILVYSASVNVRTPRPRFPGAKPTYFQSWITIPEMDITFPIIETAVMD